MKKRFIVLIDLSEFSGNLIRYASGWALEAGAELHLLHQTFVMAPALSDPASKKNMALFTNQEAMKQLKALASTLVPDTLKISYSVSEHSLQYTLNEMVSTSYEQLIFTGIKGTGFLKKTLIGSKTLDVINITNYCFVAIPKEIAIFSHEKIFVAVSPKHSLNELELNRLLNFMNHRNTSLTFFYLAKPNENTLEIHKQLQEISNRFAVRFITDVKIFKGNSAFEDIKKVINNKVEELLVIQKGSRFITDRMFRTFLVNELVYEGQTPLVILPQKQNQSID